MSVIQLHVRALVDISHKGAPVVPVKNVEYTLAPHSDEGPNPTTPAELAYVIGQLQCKAIKEEMRKDLKANRALFNTAWDVKVYINNVTRYRLEA